MSYTGRVGSSIVRHARQACIAWAYFSKPESDGSLSLWERGRPKPPNVYSVAPSDVLRVVEKLRRGNAPVCDEYAQRILGNLTWRKMPEDVVDVVVQLAVFDEVRYWGHGDFLKDSQSPIMVTDGTT